MIIKDFDLDDVFVMSEILNKTGIILDLGKAIESVKTKGIENLEDLTSAGKELMITVIADVVTSISSAMHKAKPEIKQLIANLTGKSTEEVGKLTLKEIKLFFKELSEREGFLDFLKEAGSSKE